MVSIIMLIMYFYGIIGMECFHPNTRDIKSSYYESDTYGDFSSFSMTLIALFQILTQSSWHSMTLHFADNFDYTGTIIYFGSFHLIQVIILLNLTSGLIWEVFTIVPSDEILEEVEAQNIEEDKMSPKKRKSSTKNLLMFEENDPKKPIDRSDALKKMDDIPEVISSESSSHGSASDSENPSLTAPIQGSNSIYIYIYVSLDIYCIYMYVSVYIIVSAKYGKKVRKRCKFQIITSSSSTKRF